MPGEMPAWTSPSRLIRLGPALLLSSIAAAAFLLFFGEFIGGIDKILIVLIPLLLIGSTCGLIVTIIGAIAWSLRAPLHRLLWLGLAFTALGVACFVVSEKMNFGFDDPSILFTTVLTGAALFVGILFLLAAGIRRYKLRERKA